jgi:hypothetical protein
LCRVDGVKGASVRPPPQCQGVLLCLQRLLSLPTERQAELLLFSIYALQRDGVFHATPTRRNASAWPCQNAQGKS